MKKIPEYESLSLAEKVIWQRHDAIHWKDVAKKTTIKNKVLLENVRELLADANIALSRKPAKTSAAQGNIEYSIEKISKFLETL